MSFTDEVVMALADVALARTCCRKAFVCGLFINARVNGDKEIFAELRNETSAQMATKILKKQFSADAQIQPTVRAGRKFYGVSVDSRALKVFLQQLQAEEANPLANLVKFQCAECEHAFFRGVFVACGSINDPKKSYHLELALKNSETVKPICDFLTNAGFEPKLVTRANSLGLYYKKNSVITDFMHYIGASDAGYSMTDAYIERSISNIEHRATNCVAKNIEKTVSTSIKHIEAIEYLSSFGSLNKLGDDICYTAKLRLENPSATLAELAKIHEPPISKSGLNKRLLKILKAAELLHEENNK